MNFDMYQAERDKAEVMEGLKVWRFETKDNKPAVMVFLPKAIKPYCRYRFETPEERETFINKQVEYRKRHIQEKEQDKQKRKGTAEQLEAVKVGSIFVCSWGYDQTNIDFYQIIEKNGYMVKIRELCQESVGPTESHGMADHRIPKKDHFIKESEIITKKIQFLGDGKPRLAVRSYADAYLWDGQSEYCSWYA